MTIHDNEVLFYTGKDIQMEFELTNQVSTDGQEFDKKTLFTLEAIDEEKSIWKLTIKAGRKGSSDVATKFGKEVSRHQVIATDCTDNAHMPDELNFYIEGKLTLTNQDGTFEADVLIGQGHNARSRNNWWFGSKTMVSANINYFVDAFGILFMKSGKKKATVLEDTQKIPDIPDLINIPSAFWAQEKSINSFELYKMTIHKK